LFFCLDRRHRGIAYANLKRAIGDKFSPAGITKLARGFYQNYGQNFIEIFFIPLMGREYFNKYMTVEGSQHVHEARIKGRGVILLSIHAGSWELSNMICANLGFPFRFFARDLRTMDLDNLINSYRQHQGGKVIQKQGQMRQLLGALKNNEAIGMTADQGGRFGILVKFFAKDASMSTGAVKLALKYGCTILPVYYTRIKGPYYRTIIMPPFELERTKDLRADIHHNLQGLISIFEKYIRLYPKEYLWTYRIWKYSQSKEILVLSDDKAGHLRQAQAIVKAIQDCAVENKLKLTLQTVEINFKNKFSRPLLALSSILSGKFACQGCLWCLKKFLSEDAYRVLTACRPDMVVSSGAALAGINFVIARENNAKSIVAMRPGLLSAKRFDLVVMPRHDHPRRRKNTLVTEGALNLIDEKYLEGEAAKLKNIARLINLQPCVIGFLIGGDAKNFSLTESTMREVIRQVKAAAEKLDADILVTTSRRTSREIEGLVKNEFSGYSRCKLLVIANQKNIPAAVGGILGISSIVLTTPESISMVSEAASSGKYVFVFKNNKLSRKHESFIHYLARKKYIYLSGTAELAADMENCWRTRPKVSILQDNLALCQAIKKIL